MNKAIQYGIDQTSHAATLLDEVVSHLTVIDPRHGLTGQRLELVSSHSARGPAFVSSDYLTGAAVQFGARRPT
ncbi:hypothetical protein [Mesorhizobium sp.]|uniref:hypothetical protein n=1 Tax=Mesorhizobium sp. TaxID=1871066 RepID=UPI000FE9BB9C|nr:hypothetical protein [Mesorhizobium sp.]RWM46992.1 MAG: hypothetical protein EOR79_34165 [Mesorhizobium sp.]